MAYTMQYKHRYGKDSDDSKSIKKQDKSLVKTTSLNPSTAPSCEIKFAMD